MESKRQRVHFIAIGGSVMHNLAIALKAEGHIVSGSDDEIFEPSKSALSQHGILPPSPGWFPEKIDSSLDIVVLGMHAKADNPELIKAQEIGLTIYSFPEYIYSRSHDKQRIVIAGSHGKTTITAIIIHVLNFFNRSFDYVIGAKVKGLDLSVKLSDAPIIIIEGDEYLSSCMDPTPKLLRYQHHIGVISGISWDHANVFPTEEDYVKQFDLFGDQTPKGGILIFCEQDPMSMMIGKKERNDVLGISYKALPHKIENGMVFLTEDGEKIPLQVFGSHNLLNLSAAKELLKKIGISSSQFNHAIQSFEGAAGRLQRIASNVFKDFAHAPSKVKATVKALKETFPTIPLVSCLELHTYSSLKKDFLPQYKGAMANASASIVYFNPEKVASRGFEPITDSDIKNSFRDQNIQVFTDPTKLETYLKELDLKGKNLLLMSSGNWGNIDINKLISELDH